jgi:Ca2+-transporting ATPase
MLWFLGAAGALYAGVGQVGEAITLLAAMGPLVGLDLFLHRRARVSTAGLESRLAAHATAIREGRPVVVAARELVPGDLVVVGPGEGFPADGLIVAGDGLQADESALTGEAWPVAKRALGALPPGDEPLVAVESWGFAGTRLLTGRATLRVVCTGAETLYGEIVRAALASQAGATPLQVAVQRLVGQLVVGAAGTCLLLAAVRMAQGYGWLDAVVSAVTLAAAALPEEFPVVFACFLGVGVYRLARRQALVRRAVSVENLGRISAVCTDKTGTVTEGRLRLLTRLPAPGVSASDLLALAALASRPEAGDPLDQAIHGAAVGAGVLRAWPRLATFPFSEGRRRETAIVQEPGGARVAVTKGAAEDVLARCALDAAARAAWARRVAELTAAGQKTLGCAWRPLAEGEDAGVEPEGGYVLAGLLGFEDPVRPGVREAVAQCRQADIHVLMVTGDHPATARAVAAAVGLGGGQPRVITGEELGDRLTGPGGLDLRSVDVVARATPVQKLQLVQALQARGEMVVVTGDGVNDVPALRAADVGVAMGERSTQSAREAAAVVLLDDNFRTLVEAIREGRQLFENLRTAFLYLLVVHVPVVASAAVLPLAGFPLLYLPVHVVWLELIIHPTALLVFQALAPRGRLGRARADRRARLFSRRQWITAGLAGGLVTGAVVGGYLRAVAEPGGVEHGRALALATVVLAHAVLAGALSGLRTWVACGVVMGSLGLSALLIQHPVSAGVLHLAPLHAQDWLLALASGGLAAVAALGGEPRRARD